MLFRFGRWALLLCCIFLLKGVKPVWADDAPVQVTVGTYLAQITGVDLKNNAFGVDFYLWFRWKGDSVKPQDTWELANGRVLSKTPPSLRKIGDENYAFVRVQGTITQYWNLEGYPLDSQIIHIDIEDSENESHKVVYVADTQNTSCDPDLKVPGWQIDKRSVEVSPKVYATNYGDTSIPTGAKSSYSRYNYSINISRLYLGRFVKVFFPLLIATFTSWLGFWVRPKDAPPRVSIGLGALFAAAAASLAINNALPDTNVTTMADRLITICLGLIFASCLETVLAMKLFNGDKEAFQVKMDRVCAFAFPLIFLLLLATYVLR